MVARVQQLGVDQQAWADRVFGAQTKVQLSVMADAPEERVRTTVTTFFPLHAQVAAPAGAQVALQAQAQAGQAEVQYG